MGANIVIVCLVLSTYSALPTTPAAAPQATTPPSNFSFLSSKPPSTYQVTENVIDIPDNRTLPPIVPNYSTFRPLNLANTSISINNNINNKNDTGDENTQVINKLKKTKNTLTYIHITKDPETENGLKKLFRGVKDYLYNLKKGAVDGLHRFFYKTDANDKEKYIDNYSYLNYKQSDKGHRSYDNKEHIDTKHDQSNEDDEFDDELRIEDIRSVEQEFGFPDKFKEKRVDDMKEVHFHHKFDRSYDSKERIDDTFILKKKSKKFDVHDNFHGKDNFDYDYDDDKFEQEFEE